MNPIKSLDPTELAIRERHHHLLNGIGPRPIGWVSTIDGQGRVNLAPFSFFNIFSSNPPVVIFSPARRGRDNTTKHTLHNVTETKQCVINLVDSSLVYQMVLSSLEYPEGVNEMEMAGLTAIESLKVKVPRVAESPMQLECEVTEIKQLGIEGAAGNLVIAEVKMIHIHENKLSESGFLDQEKLGLVGRMGEAWYVHANLESMFEVKADVTKAGIGFPALPKIAFEDDRLNGNELAQMAMCPAMPDETEVNEYKLLELSEDFLAHQDEPEMLKKVLHQKAKSMIASGDARSALLTLLTYNS